MTFFSKIPPQKHFLFRVSSSSNWNSTISSNSCHRLPSSYFFRKFLFCLLVNNSSTTFSPWHSSSICNSVRSQFRDASAFFLSWSWWNEWLNVFHFWLASPLVHRGVSALVPLAASSPPRALLPWAWWLISSDWKCFETTGWLAEIVRATRQAKLEIL